MHITITITLVTFLSLNLIDITLSKSVIMANYHNVLLFFPKEYGGNDDLRVIFDVRNVTLGTFKYMPVIVDVAYDSLLNQAYCYMESAITSYIMLLKWSGGSWCYQVLFDFPASQFSKYMYHSIILVDNFVYWTTDRFIMSGRLPGYEKRLLLQPGWNRLYSMTHDKKNQVIYVAAFDYTENALFRCNLKVFSCKKLITTEPTINYIYFNIDTLYLASIQGNYLYRYAEDYNSLMPINTVKQEVANIMFFDEQFAIYTNQQSITVSTNLNAPNSTRKAQAHLIDPYALQYVFTFNQIANFDTYPYPYHFSDYHNLLYKNSLYLFYFYICGMDIVENDHVFLPQMDLNNQFLRIENCENKYLHDRQAYIIPSIIAACVTLLILTIGLTICVWRSKMCMGRKEDIKEKFLGKYKKKQQPEKKSLSQNQVYGTHDFQPEINLKLAASNTLAQKSFSQNSGISSLPSVSDQYVASYPPPQLPSSQPPPTTHQNIYSPSAKNSIPFESELYDNDPINLTDLNYSRYSNNLNPKSVSSKKKFINGNGFVVKNFKSKNSSTRLSSPSSFSAGSTPSLSQNSESGNSSLTIDSISASIPLSPSSPKVKFNEFQIHHHYDQYEYPSSPNSHAISRLKMYESTVKMLPQYLLSPNHYEEENDDDESVDKSLPTFSSSSTYSSSSNTSDIKTANPTKIRGKYYTKDYISTCNVPLYSAKNKPQNYINVIKAVNLNKPSLKKPSKNDYDDDESVEVFSI